MEQNLIVALIGGLGGMLGWGFADFFAKKTIDQIGDVVTLFWGQLFGLVPLSILFFFSRSPIPHKLIANWPYVILLGVWTGLSYIPVYVAFRKGKVSLISPIQATYSVLVIIALAILFHQIIPFSTLVDFLIIFIGVLFMKIDIHDLLSIFHGKVIKNRKINGLKEIIFANILYAIWIIALDKFINGEYWLPYLFVIHTVSVASIYGYAVLKKINLKITDNSLWKFLIAIGFCDIFAFSAFYYGLSQTSYVSIVVMLSSAFSLPTIILAHFALKERITKTQIAAVITVILGVMALAIQA
jgi:drug/metabolite transporter (DMT)-like permease